ncbi:MAG TPA: AbrB/MazE/SpoVT family DNA-binding domain-containing protein [Candidatus Sabulitectum sp.]|nr:AbrB/MazE/SpoVT family DNA-binding domain-containing protein [Candidatus Sabulitectum sp.]HPJ28793.1 AbrB/MazE/SpoVT family DNA-binding domain-containing protein [Candidatus Sabulitectum sp.]HPR23074.1 AbrB/MazE/SpoVT family DNA-binding domain-containing protein [Candidatus Sabulitectum sp.]
MSTVKLSPKYQIVIPRGIREAFSLEAGDFFEVIAFDHRIELIPIRPMSSVRGFLKGCDPSFSRDEEDRAHQ